jgi:hypothetical protein
MNESDLIPWAEAKGLADGESAAPYAGPLRWDIAPEVDSAYVTAYWTAFAGYTGRHVRGVSWPDWGSPHEHS